MDYIREIGMVPYGKQGRTIRKAIYECSKCGKEITCVVSKMKKQTKALCQSCAASDSQTKHGLSKSDIYKRWKQIKQRCFNRKSTGYDKYGGAGITMCDLWKNNFEEFNKWAITNGFKKELTIDRRNNTLGYEPSNCRWVDNTTQAVNKRIKKENTSGYIGVGRNGVNWYSRIKVKKKSISLGTFKTAREAAIIRNNYIIANKLDHELNIV